MSNGGAYYILFYREGYSQHGDYVFGWKGDSLQRAMVAGCTGAVCRELKVQTSEEAMKCTKEAVFKDEVDGCESHRQAILDLRLDWLTTTTCRANTTTKKTKKQLLTQ